VKRLLLALVALSPIVPCAGCSVVLSPGEEQCEAVTDCSDRGFANAACVEGVCVDTAASGGNGGGGGEGGAVDPVWGCLGNVVEKEPDPTKTLEISFRLAFATTGDGVKTAVVDICDKLDIGCTGASEDFPKGLSTDNNGVVTATVREGFDGFVRITSTEIVDSRVYVGRPIVEIPKTKEIQLLTPMEYEFLAETVAGTELDPTRGSSIMLAIDCQGEAASGVRFETPGADADSLEFYLINQSPTPPPAATATDVDGFGGFFNLKPAQTLGRAFREEDEVYIGESSFGVFANTISYVQIGPTPE
jgi:hypothetical protein